MSKYLKLEEYFNERKGDLLSPEQLAALKASGAQRSLDERFKQEGFSVVGEVTSRDLGTVIASLVPAPVFFDPLNRKPHVEVRVVDKSRLSPDYKPGETFVVYHKRPVKRVRVFEQYIPIKE